MPNNYLTESMLQAVEKSGIAALTQEVNRVKSSARYLLNRKKMLGGLLNEAISSAKLKSAGYLIDLGVDVNGIGFFGGSETGKGWAPLREAEHAICCRDWRNKTRSSEEMFANVKILALLLRMGAVNGLSSSGAKSIFKLLVDNLAQGGPLSEYVQDISSSSDGKISRAQAFQADLVDIVRYFQSIKVVPSESGVYWGFALEDPKFDAKGTPLHYTVRGNSSLMTTALVSVIKTLPNGENILNARDSVKTTYKGSQMHKKEVGKTPLHDALIESSFSTAQQLLTLRYDNNVNAVDEHKRTPLHYLIMTTKEWTPEAIDVLNKVLFYGANTLLADKLNNQPWHYFSGSHAKNVEQAIEILLRRTAEQQVYAAIAGHVDQQHPGLNKAARAAAIEQLTGDNVAMTMQAMRLRLSGQFTDKQVQEQLPGMSAGDPSAYNEFMSTLGAVISQTGVLNPFAPASSSSDTSDPMFVNISSGSDGSPPDGDDSAPNGGFTSNGDEPPEYTKALYT